MGVAPSGSIPDTTILSESDKVINAGKSNGNLAVSLAEDVGSIPTPAIYYKQKGNTYVEVMSVLWSDSSEEL